MKETLAAFENGSSADLERRLTEAEALYRLTTTLFPDYDYSDNTLFVLIADSHYEANRQRILEFKRAHEETRSFVDEETGEERTETVNLPVSDEEYINFYLSLELDRPLFPYDVAAAREFYTVMLGAIRNSESTDGRIGFLLSDLADVQVRYDYASYAYFGALPAIQIEVYAEGGANINAVVSAVERTMSAYTCQYSDASVVMLDNQSSFITQSVSGALSSLLLGAALAVAIIYLFLRNIKSSLIIAVSMPLSVLASLGCMHLMGITLNMVSIGGLTVGIGMLVDNSIVVLESVTSKRDKGKTKLQAASDGTKLVLKSLVGSTVTSVCVFFPILFLTGLTREIFADLAWAIIFSLSFSLLTAITVIPTLYCLTKKKKTQKDARPQETTVPAVAPMYAPTNLPNATATVPSFAAHKKQTDGKFMR